MDKQHKQMSIGAVFLVIGILLVGVGVGGATLSLNSVSYGFIVVDSVSGKPVSGALVTLSGTFSGGGTVPFQGTTDVNGLASVHVSTGCLPVVRWGVSANGYVTQTGVGTPVNPLTIHLVSCGPNTVPQDPSNSSDTNPPPSTSGIDLSQYEVPLMSFGGFMLFSGFAVLFMARKSPHN